MCSGVNVLVDDTIKASKKYLISKIYRIFPLYAISSALALVIRQLYLGRIGFLSRI